MAAGVVVGFTIDSAMGLMGYLGVPNTQLNNSLYFMFLGLRVVDAFVLASEFGHHTMLDAELSVAKRVSRTACSGGMSFPIVSATDALASLVRTTTVLPALDWLCTWAGVAIIFTGGLCANCACGHWHDVICTPCALHSSVPDGFVALSAADESWACDLHVKHP